MNTFIEKNFDGRYHKEGRGIKFKEIIPKELINLIPNIIFVITPEYDIVQVNKHACNILQVDEYALLNSSFLKICEASEREKIEKTIEDCLNTGRVAFTHVNLVSSEGLSSEVDLTMRRYPENKSIKKFFCVIAGKDVSEEKKKELDLLRFSNIAHHTINPVEITDVNGKIIYVNPAFEKASGYSKEDLIGKNPNVFGSGKQPKKFWQQMWNTINSGKTWIGKVENKRRDGQPFYTELLVSPILDADSKIIGYFGVHKDLTEQKHLEEQLVHAQKMESIGLLAAGIAHEVGNPLTSISSIVQILQRAVQDEFTQEKLELIKSQVTRISKIIRDLVDFSRRSSYEIQMTNINQRIREAVEIVRVGKKAKDIKFVVELADKIPLQPLVPDQIEQIFINILINAVDAIASDNLNRMENKLPSKKGEIYVSSSISDEHIEIKIKDNGKGIPKELLPKIFEPFFTTKRVGEGTGLGLWVSYGIAKSFHGDIEVESEEGVGTLFKIVLPIRSTSS